MNSEQPLVSIIIPTFNRAHLIGETLDSVLAQTYKNWECIIVDDGSSDNTDEVVGSYVKKDPRFQYHHRPADRPKGANACRNYGFEMSSGEYANWFDDDDIMDPKKIFVQINALINSNFNFCVCQTIVFDKNLENKIGLRHEKIYSSNVFEDYLSQKIMWLTQSPLWKKEFLIKFNYKFDEELQAAQEWEFHCRILFKHNQYLAIDTPLVYIRKHSNSISFSNENNENRRLHYLMAREKISFFLTENASSNILIDRYLLNSYIHYLRNFKYKISYRIFTKHLIFSKYLSAKNKLKLVMGFISFLILKKGEVFLKNCLL